MNDQTVQASFAEDHDRLDQLFETYRRLKRIDFAQAKQAFKEFKFGLQRHIIWEESVLFPLFEKKTGMRDVGPTAVMRAEHREIGRRLEALHDKDRGCTGRPQVIPCLLSCSCARAVASGLFR
jgi:iron-sulfur cluster repair protein YtfE (RIC family)